MKLELGQVVTQIISFLFMLWILKKYAWKPLFNVLEARKSKIKKDFEAIEAQQLEVESIKKEYIEKLKQVDAYARIKTQEGIDQGKQAALQIQKEAHAQAKALIVQAQSDLQKEIREAKLQLKSEVANMAIMAAEKVIGQNLNDPQQKRLVLDFIEQMEPNQ